MKKFSVDAIPETFNATGCVVARARKRNSVIFVKTPDGRIYHASWNRGPIDLLADFRSNDSDRSVFAKLAGIRVKDMEEARKAAKAQRAKDDAADELQWVRQRAKRLGLKLVPARK